jgi:hypothetical protein
MPNDPEKELLERSTMFPSNSRTPRGAEPERKKLDKVIVGEAKQQKRSVWKRFSDSFAADTNQSVAEYVIYDVLIPAAKDLIFDTIRGALEMKMYGQKQGRGTNRDRGRSYPTNYNSISYRGREIRSPQVEISRTARARHDFDDVILPTRGDAEQVLTELNDLVIDYKAASVADFYELCGLDSSFTDNKYGWTDLRGAYVSRAGRGGGYIINLPRTQPID